MHVRLVRVRCRGSGLPCRQLSFHASSLRKDQTRARTLCSNSISFSNATSIRLPVGEGPPFGPYTSPVEVLGEGTYGAEFEVCPAKTIRPHLGAPFSEADQ